MAHEPVGLPFRGGAGAHPRLHEWLGCAAQKQALLSMGGISHGGSRPELYPILLPCYFRVAGTSPRLGGPPDSGGGVSAFCFIQVARTPGKESILSSF